MPFPENADFVHETRGWVIEAGNDEAALWPLQTDSQLLEESEGRPPK